MKKTKNLYYLCLSLMITSSPLIADEEKIDFDLEVIVQTDDNLNLAANDTYAIDDNSAIASAGLSLSENLNRHSIINYFSKFEYQQFNEYENLNNATATFGVKFRHKAKLGFTDPTLILSFDGKLIDSKTDIRDSTQYNFGIAFSRRHTTTLSSRFGLNTNIRESKSRSFDTKDIRFFANADLALSNASTLYSTYSFIDGDSVASLQQNNALGVISLAEEIDIDLAYGNNYFSYRIPTTTNVLTLGFNHSIARKQSLDLSILAVHSDAGSNIDYQRIIANLSYMARF